MKIQCEDCSCQPDSNDEKFYEMRITSTGLDLQLDMVDKILCQECIEQWITENGISTIQSIRRIENPING